MSTIFENDINIETEDLSALEDSEYDELDSEEDVVVYPQTLYRLKLEYSCEGLYAAVQEGTPINKGDFVVIPTRYGKDIALVMGRVNHPLGIKKNELVIIDRKATDDDLEKFYEFQKKEKEAFVVFKEKVIARHLEMKLIATHFMLEEQKALFFFTSDNRVDFRELVKDLVAVFKMRIELRQVGVRDDSRITGGLGVCGRPYCCHAVSDKLRPVSIRMAKDQNLSLNSMKISGQCGRLLCCLAFEWDVYAEARKKLPGEGLRLFYDNTNFRVIEVNPISSMVKMLGEDGRLVEINSSRFTKEGGRWKIN